MLIIFQAVSFPGDTEESVFKFDMEKVVQVYYWWMVRFEPTTKKPMVPPSTPFVEKLEGY